ncbi:MAG TPA: hypothetical protein VE131_11440 [Terriglobales bacterium]|nr:hypothetical protein [Terriglobales bacterium]
MIQPSREQFEKLLMRQEGFLLIAALTLLSSLVLLGTTAYLLSSTDIKIGGNFKTSQMTLQVAMAGTERAREILRQTNAGSSDPGSFGDELLAVRGTNSTLNGYSASTDDVPIVLPSPSTMNGVSYVVYLTNDPQDSGGIYSTTDTNKKAMLTAVATGPNNARAQVQTVVAVNSGATSPATIYSKGDVTGNGSSLTISGNDACGQASALSPIYTKDPATTDLDGNPTLSGSPATPQHGSLDIDIASLVDSLKPSAGTTLYEDTQNTTYGSSTNYTTVYSWPDDPDHLNTQGLSLSNVTGYGILLVKGDLYLGGGFSWNGVIIATGSITLNGGGGPNAINIAGQVFSGTSTVTDITLNGSNVINYDSCKTKKAWAGAPLTVVNWKQSY